MFGGRFAKPARRNKIILEKISKIENTIDNNGSFPSQDQLQKKSIQTLLNFKTRTINPIVLVRLLQLVLIKFHIALIKL